MKRNNQTVQVEVDENTLKRAIHNKNVGKSPVSLKLSNDVDEDIEDEIYYEDDGEYLPAEQYDDDEDDDYEDDSYDNYKQVECNGENCPFAKCKNCEYLNGLVKKSKDYKKVHKSRFTAIISYVIIVVLIALVFYVLGITFFPEDTNSAITGAISWVTGEDGLRGVFVKAFNTCKEVFSKLSNVNQSSSSEVASLISRVSVI